MTVVIKINPRKSFQNHCFLRGSISFASKNHEIQETKGKKRIEVSLITWDQEKNGVLLIQIRKEN